MADQFDNAPDKPGWQAHHRITQDLVKTNPMLQKLVELKLFRLKDFVTNGIMLPSDPLVAAAKGVSTHLGYHGQYSRFIEKMVGLATSGFSVKSLDDEIQAGKLAGRVRAIQAHAEMALSGVLPGGHIPLNRVDPIVPRNPLLRPSTQAKVERAWVASYYDSILKGMTPDKIDKLVDWGKYELLKRAGAFDPDIDAAERATRVARAEAVHAKLQERGRSGQLARLEAAGEARLRMSPAVAGPLASAATQPGPERAGPPSARAPEPDVGESHARTAPRAEPALARGSPVEPPTASTAEPPHGRPAAEPHATATTSAPGESARAGLGARLSTGARVVGRLAGPAGSVIGAVSTGVEVWEDLRHDRVDAAKEKVKDYALETAGGAVGAVGASAAAIALGANPLGAAAAGLVGGYYLAKAKGNPVEALRMMTEDAAAAGQWIGSTWRWIRGSARDPRPPAQLGPHGEFVHTGPQGSGTGAASSRSELTFPTGRDPDGDEALRAFAGRIPTTETRPVGGTAGLRPVAPTLESAERRRSPFDGAYYDRPPLY